ENNRKNDTFMPMHYLEEQQKPPNSKQYDYEKRKSTVDAISYIVNQIKTRETTYVLGLFVDFSNAFDRMSWLRLFSLLRDLLILQISCLQLASVLFREILIRTPKCIARRKINRRCPQYSILGLILWNTYLHDLLGLLDREESIIDFAAYVDDLYILVSGSHRELEIKANTA
ncbi:hypothetical protein HN011_001662, partial [Eciton burchellii]